MLRIFSRRTLPITILFLLGLLLAACAGAEQMVPGTAVPTPLPTLVLEQAALAVLPTPTLDPAAPTRSLPTPPVTPRAGERAAPLEAVPTEPAGPTAVPSATPLPQERLALGNGAFALLDYKTAVEQFSRLLREEEGLDEQTQVTVLYKLGQAYLAEEQWVDAATIFNQLIALTDGDPPRDTTFYLGQAYMAQEAYGPAVDAYTSFLALSPELGAYIYPLIGQTQQALGDDAAAVAAYEAALESPASRLKEISNRRLLADAHLAQSDTEQAVAQFDAIRAMAETEATQGQMNYLAGAAELAGGDIEAALERFQTGLVDYPGAYESYLGLVELVKAEAPVDDFQRGLVDFNAAAYAPGIEAFQAYLAANPADYRPETHRYLALSYEALGDLEQAAQQMAEYADLAPQEGLLELAKLQARAGETETAAASYDRYVTDYPEAEDAPFAAWWSAALTAQLGEVETAIARFIRLAENYPDHIDAPEAFHDAGVLAWENEDPQTAIDLWLRAARQFPASRFGSAALLNLVRYVPEDDADVRAEVEALAADPAAVTYQALRARDLVAGIPPFAAEPAFAVPADLEQVQLEAETWLAEQFELEPTAVSSTLSAELAGDGRLLVGQRLWELGLLPEAQRELEALRQAYTGDPLATYQLALFFRDLGLFRSSIAAATSLLSLAGQHELQAPVAIGRLSYPIYYADFILPLAEKYGFDPRLQFSLVRQESLFESFARSGAAAQGLSQVIPDTGAWIAERLGWPDYENDDLYKPNVGLNFGAYYLAQQLAYFDGDVHAALAAYNAGPGNAARWHETAGSDLDLFVDTIDFPETEMYVERIYAGFDIYRQLYAAQQ
jgi:soluble lytic murein transglycosylase